MELSLYDKILNRVKEDNLNEDHELVVAAYKFKKAVEDLGSDPPLIEARKFLGIWARTRRLWCEYSGESLI
jgi:hypothetical protein